MVNFHTLSHSHPLLAPISDLLLDLYIPSSYGLDHRDIALDGTVAHPHAQSLVHQAARFGNVAAAITERAKYAHYGELCHRHNFLLLVGFDIYEVASDKSSEFFRGLATRDMKSQNLPPPGDPRFLYSFAFCCKEFEPVSFLHTASLSSLHSIHAFSKRMLVRY